MQSAWSERDAQAAVDHYGHSADFAGIGPELALRVYSTRQLGRDPKLVLHGGGNTSVKLTARDLTGADVPALHIKGSGWDMGVIEPPGMPAVRLEPLLHMRSRDSLSDDDMARVLRSTLLDPQSPSPSVETLLHAFIPAAVVDHTHATAVLSLIDQPDAAALCAEVYGARMGYVPYIMPGFALAKAAADAFDKNPKVEGLILDKHGIFTFGATAREAYERMIEMVTLAEQRVAKGTKTFVAMKLPAQIAPAEDVAPIVRGACTLKNPDGAHKRLILEFRTSDEILSFVNGKDVARYALAGVLTPDHAIRTKAWPMILAAPEAGKLAEFKTAAHKAAQDFIGKYTSYFERNKARSPSAKMHDPLPRVVLVPGLGIFGLGDSAKAARIAADVYEAAIEGIAGAEKLGTFTSITEPDMFDMEYWSLELAKLGQKKTLPLEGQVAVVTGAGGAIGAATAKLFALAGAEVALLDRDATAAAEKAKAVGGTALAVECDVTNTDSVRAAFAKVAKTFGGVDIVVSNAGAAWQGKIGDVDEKILRESFELNFFAHQKVAQAAVKIMLAQDAGGCLLFNVSKQAVNPGANFGPYGLPKAALLLLVRQYALDYGADGIRANGVNADRIRSGLLTGDFIKERAKARGVSEADYMSGNLLAREVTAQDVAQAFLAQAVALKTTADVTTVDGGNIAAALR
jgi:rhamnose utilization protein RhaD (predicted bifunctional aldolase and dehydrogenase)/NAD(P)-dependent dehydrogenase (short-subunit alcohol dehydrogenase family)